MLTEAERLVMAMERRKIAEEALREVELMVGIAKRQLAIVDANLPIVRPDVTPEAAGRCTEAEKAEMIRLHTQDGLSANRIARHMNRTYRTVERVLIKARCLRRVYQ